MDLLGDPDYLEVRSEVLAYFRLTDSLTKSMCSKKAPKLFADVTAEFRVWQAKRADIAVPVRQYPDLLTLYDYDSVHSASRIQDVMLELSSKAVLAAARHRPTDSMAHSGSIKTEPGTELKHLVLQELIKDIALLPLHGKEALLQPFAFLATVNVMHDPLPLPATCDDMEAARLAATRIQGNLVGDLVTRAKNTSTVREGQVSFKLVLQY